MELLKLYSKETAIFLAKSSWYLLRSDRCLINVNVSLEAILEGQEWW